MAYRAILKIRELEMGLNAASVHVRIGSSPEAHRTAADAIRRTLFSWGYVTAPNARSADRTVVIHPAFATEWLTIFDSEMTGLDSLAAALSLETGADAVCSSIRLSDAMRLALFRQGRLVDSLASRGRQTIGKPALWTSLLVPPATPEQFLEAFELPAIFAEDKLAALAGALGLNRDLCLAHVDELLDAPGRPVGLRIHVRREALATA